MKRRASRRLIGPSNGPDDRLPASPSATTSQPMGRRDSRRPRGDVRADRSIGRPWPSSEGIALGPARRDDAARPGDEDMRRRTTPHRLARTRHLPAREDGERAAVEAERAARPQRNTRRRLERRHRRRPPQTAGSPQSNSKVSGRQPVGPSARRMSMAGGPPPSTSSHRRRRPADSRLDGTALGGPPPASRAVGGAIELTAGISRATMPA